MSTIKSKKVQLGTDANSANNFTLYQPATPDGTLRIGVGNADSPTEVGQFNANGYKPAAAPMISVFQSSAQTISAATWTKVEFQSKTIDTTNAFDTSTYQFQPTVAGYYQINYGLKTSTSQGRMILNVYRNTGGVKTPVDMNSATYGLCMSALIYLNGTTDYLTGYVYMSTGGPIIASSQYCYFDAYLIQQA